MQPLIFDDFLPNAAELRESVIAQGFGPFQFGPTLYQGINVSFPMWPIWDAIETALGTNIKEAQGFFRVSDKDHKLDTYIHADLVFAKWAAILYLTPEELIDTSYEPCGTAFWKHNDTGLESHHADLVKDWTIPEKWKITYVADMFWNRCIIYPTQYFHSPWPFEGWGDKPENARMIWGGFFNILA